MGKPMGPPLVGEFLVAEVPIGSVRNEITGSNKNRAVKLTYFSRFV